MSMKKYLEQINLPKINSDAFAIRLKYELKREFFSSRRRTNWLPIATTALATMFMVLFSIMVISPNTASKVHYAIFSSEKNLNEQEFDIPLTAGRSIVPRRGSYSSANSAIQVVSDLSQLDPNKSYMIKRVTNRGKGSRYYVSEVQSRRRTRGPIY